MDKDNGEKDPSSDERPPYDFLNRMSNPVKKDLKAARLEKQMPWILISSNHTISWLIHQ